MDKTIKPSDQYNAKVLEIIHKNNPKVTTLNVDGSLTLDETYVKLLEVGVGPFLRRKNRPDLVDTRYL